MWTARAQWRGGCLLSGALVLIAFAARPSVAEAQGVVSRTAAETRGLVGRVTDDAGDPVADAEIRVGGVLTIGRSGLDGWFRVPDAPTGLMWFGVRKLGYRPAAELVRLSPGDTVDVVIERIGAELDTVKVQARADAMWEREVRRFEQAIDVARFGTVVTADDIARRQPIVTSDLFQTMAGFRVLGSGGSATVVGRGNCQPFLVVDGMPAAALRVNDLLPQSIRVLIAFRSFAQLPAQLQFPTANQNCGAIVIYTL